MKIIYKSAYRFNSHLSPSIDLASFGNDNWQLCAVVVYPRGSGLPEEMEYIFSKTVED